MGDFAGHPFRGNQWIQGGSSLGTVYHGSSARVEKPSLDKVQSRDYGFYGPGFYVASDPSMTKGYGRTVTAYTVSPEATVLHAEMLSHSVPGLRDAILAHAQDNWRPAAVARGKSAEFDDEMAHVLKSPASWKDAVTRFAQDIKVDVVKFGRGEIVVRNPSVLTAIPKGGKSWAANPPRRA